MLLEVGIISRKQKEDCKRGAKVQEQFDTAVLQLPWNRLVAGPKVDAEEIREITVKPVTESEEQRLREWYEPVVDELPLAVGRLICQRTNITYDLRVRKTYASILLGVAALMFLALTVIGLAQDLALKDIILTMYLPALPIIAFMLREHRKQGETLESLSNLKAEVEKLWERALSGAHADELTVGSRALQDAIFRHRGSNPLVFDWLYNRVRSSYEDLTHHAAARLVAEAHQRLNTTRAR